MCDTHRFQKICHSGRCDSIPIHILHGQSLFNTPMAISAISTVSLTEAYDLKVCHSVPTHQVTLLITDVHSRTQSLPKTSCRYEAVKRYPCFDRYWNLEPSDWKVSQGSSNAPFQEIFEFMASIFSKRVTWQRSWRAIQYTTVDHGMGHMWKSQLNDGNCKILELKFQRAVHQFRISHSPNRDNNP
jgi:hypothetical protein